MRSSLTSVGAGHGHGHAAGRAADRGRLRLVLAITAVVLVVELVGAYLASSLALLADAGHLATDAAAVVLALGASYVAAMPGGPRSTFGYHRAEILAAMANAVVLLVVCGYLAWAGFNRLRSPGDVEVEAGLLIAFAAVGLLANAVSLVVLRRSDTGSLNLRGAALEVTADLVGSALALAAGVVIALTGLGAGGRGRVAADRGADPAALVVAAEGVLGGAARDRAGGPRPGRRTPSRRRDARRHRGARPPRVDHHQRHPQPLGARHGDRRGAGRARRRRHPRPALRVRRHPLRRPSRDVPGRAASRTASTRTSATCTPDGSPNPGCGSTGRCRRCRAVSPTRFVAREEKAKKLPDLLTAGSALPEFAGEPSGLTEIVVDSLVCRS